MTLEEYKLRCDQKIEAPKELLSLQEQLTGRISELEQERYALRLRLRRVKTPEEEAALKTQAKELTKQITPLRQQRKIALRIARHIPQLQAIQHGLRLPSMQPLGGERTHQRRQNRHALRQNRQEAEGHVNFKKRHPSKPTDVWQKVLLYNLSISANNIHAQDLQKRENFDMKATGIVRRIDDCGIITQRGLCRINTGVLLILSKN